MVRTKMRQSLKDTAFQVGAWEREDEMEAVWKSHKLFSNISKC